MPWDWRIGARTGFGFSLTGGSRDSSMFLSCGSSYVFSLRFSTCYGNRNASPGPLRCEWQRPRTRTSKHGLLPEESTASYHQHLWSRPSPQHISLHSRANTRGKCQLDHWVQWRRWEFESYFRNYALILVLSWSRPLPSLLKFSSQFPDDTPFIGFLFPCPLYISGIPPEVPFLLPDSVTYCPIICNPNTSVLLTQLWNVFGSLIILFYKKTLFFPLVPSSTFVASSRTWIYHFEAKENLRVGWLQNKSQARR